jgi:two-component system, chemotaxis family, chemotaxis protein CheV
VNVAENTKLLDSIDARSKLAGSNKMEVLLFSLGTSEVFGINVFKVREVTKTPPITRTPNMPAGVEGVISLRGNIIPVISLARFVNIGDASASSGATMMVTEFSRHTQAFLVHEVDRIIRIDWEKIKSPDAVVGGNAALITAITELENGRLVSILDVEQILASAFGEVHVGDIKKVEAHSEKFIMFADDSAIARKKITEVLDKLSIKYQVAVSGREAWDKLQAIAQRAQASGTKVADQVSVILTDAEMPEMDGYVLTKHVKGDVRFDGIPVVMHSSLSSEANHALGKSVGVDTYVAKFDPQVLAETLRPLLAARGA